MSDNGNLAQAIVAAALAGMALLIGWQAGRWLARKQVIGPVVLRVAAPGAALIRLVLTLLLGAGFALIFWHAPQDGRASFDLLWRVVVLLLGGALAAWALLTPTEFGMNGVAHSGRVVAWHDVSGHEFQPTGTLVLRPGRYAFCWGRLKIPLRPDQRTVAEALLARRLN